MATMEYSIVPEADHFSHDEAMRIYNAVLTRPRPAGRVTIDLGRAREASTSAFARLILLRKALLESGRDLYLVNLRDRVAHVYQLSKLDGVLPNGSARKIVPSKFRH